MGLLRCGYQRADVYGQLRQICDFLGMSWSVQRQRMLRAPIISTSFNPAWLLPTGRASLTNGENLLPYAWLTWRISSKAAGSSPSSASRWAFSQPG